MKNKQVRILAYTLAQTIESDELDNISGGSGTVIIPPTVKLTSQVRAPDVSPDRFHE